MRTLKLICLATLGFWILGTAPVAQAGVGAAPVTGVVTPSQQLSKLKAVELTPQAKKPAKRTRGKAAVREQVKLAALGSPDLSLFPAMMLTEEEAFKALERELSLKVGKHMRRTDYPHEAMRSRWTGTVLVQVVVGIDGMVREVSLYRTSGFEVLDEQALSVVRRVSKLFVPFRLRGREHAVTVPIGFYLKEV